MDNKSNIVAISALIKNKKWDKFLIIKRSANEIAYPWKWAFPGGKLEPGESIIDTLKREVLEEVGLEIENFKEFIKDFTFMRKDWHNVVGLSFAVTALTYDVKLPKDFEDFKWINVNELKDYDCISWMEEEVKIAFEK